MKPSVRAKYAHGCEDCTFIGRVDEHDVYVCDGAERPVVVARYGPGDGEYVAGPDLRLGRMRIALAQDRLYIAPGDIEEVTGRRVSRK